MFTKKQKLAPLPLIPIFIKYPFMQWGLYFIREIHPPSSIQHKWILTAMDYFAKWVEVIPARNTTDIVVIKILEENILARFGFPMKIVTNNSQVFKFAKFIRFC